VTFFLPLLLPFAIFMTPQVERNSVGIPEGGDFALPFPYYGRACPPPVRPKLILDDRSEMNKRRLYRFASLNLFLLND